MRAAAVWLVLLGCGPGSREADERVPLTSACDPTDSTRCQLPWPSNHFATVDETSVTGLRLALDDSRLRVPDRVQCLELADGFSRVTGVAVGFEAALDPDLVSSDPTVSLRPDAPLQVLTIDPEHPDYGRRWAYRTELRTTTQASGEATLLIGRPAQVLPAATDHALIALDAVGVSAPRLVRVALGLERGSTSEERALAANYAPVVAALLDADVDLERVVRVSWFTTRSRENGVARLAELARVQRAGLGDAQVVIDSAVAHPSEAVARVVKGRLQGLPAFTDDDGFMSFDEAGLPQALGTRDVPFRVVLPQTDTPYRIVLFGHGTGGNEDDESFDATLAAAGIAKVSLRFDGWTDDDFLDTSFGFHHLLEATERSTAGLSQSLSGAPVLLDALEGPLGAALSAEELGGMPNPMQGVAPDTERPAWAGGSLGGTMGAVIVATEPRLEQAVFNVPGGGWTHFIPYSLLWEIGLSGVAEGSYGEGFDTHHALLLTQTCWDDVDGAVWADELLDAGTSVLLQESMDDPVLPNLGTELLAASLGAVHLNPTLAPIVGLEDRDEPLTGGVGLTQFRVPDTGPYDVHGFAARRTPAGVAAIGQITAFLEGAWAGTPTMEHPAGCAVTEDGSCDFSGMWE